MKGVKRASKGFVFGGERIGRALGLCFSLLLVVAPLFGAGGVWEARLSAGRSGEGSDFGGSLRVAGKSAGVSFVHQGRYIDSDFELEWYKALVVGADERTPTAAQIKAGQNADGEAVIAEDAPSAGLQWVNIRYQRGSHDEVVSGGVHGLAPSTNYKLCIAFDYDDSSPEVVTHNFRTQAPHFPMHGGSLEANYRHDQGFRLEYTAQLGASYRFTTYAVVLPTAVPAPSVAQVRAGTDGLDRPALKAYTITQEDKTKYSSYFDAFGAVYRVFVRISKLPVSTQVPAMTPT